MGFLKDAKLLMLLASLLWKIGGALELRRWVTNGVESVERLIKKSPNKVDDAFGLPAIDLIRSEFDLPDIPDDQELDWSFRWDKIGS